MRMTGQRERYSRFRGGIERVRMMREQNWKSVGLSLLQERMNRSRDFAVVIFGTVARPAETE